MYTYTYRGFVITRTRDDWGRYAFTVGHVDGYSVFGHASLGDALDRVDRLIAHAAFRATVSGWSA